MAEEDYQRGMGVRRKVMGDEFVDRAMDAVTDFTQPVQDYINENCWGSVCKATVRQGSRQIRVAPSRG